MTTSSSPPPEPLLDLQQLLAGLRWRRRMWISLALLGFLGGVLLAILMPVAPTAVTRLYVVHASDDASASDSRMETEIALLETTRVAAAALDRIGSDLRPAEFLDSYEGAALTGNVLELTVSAPTAEAAITRSRALAEVFIADHIARVEAAANAEAQALVERRIALQNELAAADGARRANLTTRLIELGQRIAAARIGSPQVAAGTKIVDGPRIIAEPGLPTVVEFAVPGLVLGLGAGLGLAAVATVVTDRPVLRRDIAAGLGASIIAQLPPPRRGPAWLWQRFRGAAERRRVAGTLARAIRDDPGSVSLLELGCPRITGALARDIAQTLAADQPVVLVDDLPRRRLHKLAGTKSPFRIVDGADDPARPAPPHERHLGVGSVAPGTAWTDLARLGSETVLVVRAGHSDTAWLHTVARQLADAAVPVIGVVLVHPDPRDRSDGTLWDALRTAVRGRTAQRPAPTLDSPPRTPDHVEV